LPIPDGISPLRSLSPNHKFSIIVRLLISSGMLPDKSLPDKSRLVRLDRVPILTEFLRRSHSTTNLIESSLSDYLSFQELCRIVGCRSRTALSGL
jgi:hypothetical protein